jgi:hypothetical protein
MPRPPLWGAAALLFLAALACSQQVVANLRPIVGILTQPT